jgi:uncharacterized Zn finger protein
VSEVKDAVLALILGDDPVSEPALPAAPAAEIEIVICPHCGCQDCEVWSTTEARMADCPECSAVFMPKMVESKSRAHIIAISEMRQKMRRKVAPKMELHRFLKDD